MSGANTPQRNQTLNKIRQHQSILIDFARVSAESTDLQRLLDIACHHAARATGVAHSKVMQARHDKGDLLVVAGRGWMPGVVGHSRLGIDMLSPAGRAYQTRDVVRIGDMPAEPGFRLSRILKDHAIRAVLNAPLPIDGMVWGVVEVDSTEAHRFDEDDERFMRAFALVLALAVRHRLEQDEKEQSAADLGRKLLQADTLLSEHNHRVRNYFQVLLSILSARSRKASDERIRAEYEAVMERVTAIALAHDQLAFGKLGQTHVNAANYIEALCLGIEHTIEGELRIERDVELIHLRADRVVPLGLILNELLTNAIKYAVRGRPDAVVSVRLATVNDGAEAVLNVTDNGPGIGEGRSGSMGLKLIETLTSQLSGRLEIDSSPKGASITMHFPLVE